MEHIIQRKLFPFDLRKKEKNTNYFYDFEPVYFSLQNYLSH